MTGRFIFNPKAGTADRLHAVRDELEAMGLVPCETSAAGDAERLAADAAAAGESLVIAVGGDGTIHEVANGLMRHGDAADDRPTLGILPMGTGNDFSRTLGLSSDPAEAVQVLRARQTRTVDLIHVRCDPRHACDDAVDGKADPYCVNVAAGGFSGQLKEVLTEDLKKTWGPLAYLRGAIGTLPDLTDYRTRLRIDGKPWQDMDLLNVVVAKGRFAGGGTRVAPHAELSDAWLDVVLVRQGTAAELAAIAARLVAGGAADYTQSPRVTHVKARRVEVHSEPGMWFNVDGELLTNAPVIFRVVPAALNVVTPTLA